MKIFLVILFSFLLVGNLASAAVNQNNFWGNKAPETQFADSKLSTTDTDVYGLATKIISVLLGFLGLIVTLLFLYAGYLWMMDDGGGSGVKKAKGILQAAVIGLVIVLASFIISRYVIKTATEQIVN